MSSSYTHQAHYAAGQQQPQGYHQQAQASQGATDQQWPQYATQPPPAQQYAQQPQQPQQQPQYAQAQQQAAYTAPGYDYAAYYAQQQQWAAYQQQQQQQPQPSHQQQYAQQSQQRQQPQQQYAQQPAPQPPPSQQYAQQPAQQQQQHYAQQVPRPQQHYAPQTAQLQQRPAQTQAQATAATTANPAYYQQHYAQQQQQPQYQQPIQYQQGQQPNVAATQYPGVQQPAPVALPQQQQQLASYPAQPPLAADPSRSAYTAQVPVVQQAQPEEQSAGYAPATTALHQPQPHPARRPLPATSSSTPPRSPNPHAPRPPSQSYPNLPTSQPAGVPNTLPRNVSLPSTSQGSPTKSGGRPLPAAPGGESSPITPTGPVPLPHAPTGAQANTPPPPATRSGTLPDGPVKSFRNRRALPTPGGLLGRGSTLSDSPKQADEPLPPSVRPPQRSQTLPSPNAAARPLPSQPPGAGAPLSAQEQLRQQHAHAVQAQQQQREPSPQPPPKPTVVTSIAAAGPSAPSPSPSTPARSPTTPARPAPSSAATDIDDRPPASRLTRSPLPQPPAGQQSSAPQPPPHAQRRQSQPPPERPQPQPARPQSQQFQAQSQQSPQRQSLIMRMALAAQGSSAPAASQNPWPSSVPPLPRPPRQYVHDRVESDELKDAVRGTAGLDLDLDDAPPPPARPLSRNGAPARSRASSMSRDLPPAPGPSVPAISVASPPSPRISVSAPSAPAIEVRAPSPGIPSVAVRAASPAPARGVPSIAVDDAPSISVSSAPSISIAPAPPSGAPPNMVLSIQLDAPEPGPDDVRQKVDVHRLQPVHRGGDMQCGGCGRTMLGRVVMAMGVRWHPHCFKCALCATLLEHVSVFTHEDRPFCHFDYMENFAPRCYHCKTPIVETQYVSIEDFTQEDGHRFYHEHHFFCAECGDPFIEAKMKSGHMDEGREYTVHNGHAYCSKCHVNLRYPKCKKCRKPLTENGVEILGGKWHWECFTCAKCEKPFENPQFFERDNKAFCQPCFDIILRNEI